MYVATAGDGGLMWDEVSGHHAAPQLGLFADPAPAHQTTAPFTFIDLFAGIGGFHVALKALGGECVFASEIDKHARQTYQANHGIDDALFNDDIRAISTDKIADHDLLCAGFPCQPFSQAGKKKGFKDGEKSERGNLFFNILDVLEHKRPKAFILENVRHLVNHDDGNTFATILDYLDKADYQVSFKVIKASDFNVPQHRARVFIVGFDRCSVDTRRPFVFPTPLLLTKTMSDIFNAPCEKKVGFTLRVGGKGSVIDDRRNWEFYRVNDEVRRIGLKEATEMMGFPADYQFPVSKTQAMKQLGNSVCVDVVSAVAKSTLHYMQQNLRGNDMEITRNKGELSELYAVIKLIHQRLLHYGDAQGNPTSDAVRVIRIKNGDTALNLNALDIEIIHADTITKIALSALFSSEEISALAQEIKAGKATFSNEKITQTTELLQLTKTKGTSGDKADFHLDFEEGNLLFADQGIGIKSFLGANPTLINASQATNFIYEISGLNPDAVDDINHIETKSKIKDRILAILNAGGQFHFYGCENKTYESNLRKVDTAMPSMMADALLAFFRKKITKYLAEYPKTCLAASDDVTVVHIRLRDFIQYSMLGIFPNQTWDGNLSANGALVVRQDGELVFYHTNHYQQLKDYFYQHAFFDTPSSTRHRFGQIYRENNKFLFKLNLQVRLG
ncbi:MAG: HpaII family restriction endonuclease [Gallionella sp.]|nr:HpaII family restriction endonuclease [Gallionella sp.]MDD4957840.1 HpaII family restriction endonuclease [Gallionella sp.]